MSYEHTDARGAQIFVHTLLPGPAVEIATRKGIVTLSQDESYDLALGALTTPGEPESDKILQAIILLKEHQRERAERAEREAEDAKVDEYRTLTLSTIDVVAPAWSGLTDGSRDGWRKKYRAAREFFTRDEKPAPRVLNHGDPEPDRSTKWQDADGDIMTYSGRYWHSAKPTGSSTGWARWQDWTADCFPWTEVL